MTTDLKARIEAAWDNRDSIDPKDGSLRDAVEAAILKLDSGEERVAEDGSAENAIDGQTADFWHTEWKNASPNHPHWLILNLGKSQVISGFRYVPRQSEGAGRIKDYRIYVGDNLVQYLILNP